jgi:hypothetical protein
MKWKLFLAGLGLLAFAGLSGCDTGGGPAIPANRGQAASVPADAGTNKSGTPAKKGNRRGPDTPSPAAPN